MTIEEHDINEPPVAEVKSWQDHNWTGDEIRFCAEMLKHGNKSRAVRAAYPHLHEATPGGLATKANQVLARPHVVEYIAAVRVEMKANMVVTKERVLEEIARLAYSNMSDFIVIDEDGRSHTDFSMLTQDQLAAIQELEIHTYVEPKTSPMAGREVKAVKFRLAPKLPALELLGKNLKLFTDVVETHSAIDSASVLRERRFKRDAQEQEEASTDDTPIEEQDLP